MNEKAERFYRKVAKYGGWREVPAQRIHAVLEEIVQPGRMGFTVARPGLFANPLDRNITHVIKLRRLKGAACDICFGVSLSYVPYPFLPRVRWHRTLKSAGLDLFCAPQVDGRTQADATAADENPYFITIGLGEQCLRDEMSRAWEKSSPLAASWFEGTRSLEGILRECSLQIGRSGVGVKYLPGARLVAAFTLARLGRKVEADSELRKFSEEYQEGAEAMANLNAALVRVHQGTN